MVEDTKEATGSFFKLTNPDGTAFHDGTTRYELGKTVRKRKCVDPELCTSTVLHASRKLMGALKYAKVPLAIWKVEGVPVVSDDYKDGFFSLTVREKIEPSDELLGFRYHEACHPVNPMLIQNDITDADISDLRSWTSVWASVRNSVRASVWASVGDSVGDSVWDSVGDSVEAYIGSLFPGIVKWKYVKHDKGIYPFESAARLWKRGFVSAKIGTKWHLYGWRDGNAVSLYQQTEEGF